jgi:hypothetical protein
MIFLLLDNKKGHVSARTKRLENQILERPILFFFFCRNLGNIEVTDKFRHKESEREVKRRIKKKVRTEK